LDGESDEEAHNNHNANYFQTQTGFVNNNGNSAVQIDNNINVNNIIESNSNMIINDSTVNNNTNQLNGGSGYALTSSGNLVTNNNSNTTTIGFQYAEVNESADTLDLGATFDNFMFSE
jgi:hypothetical protein